MSNHNDYGETISEQVLWESGILNRFYVKGTRQCSALCVCEWVVWGYNTHIIQQRAGLEV